MVSSTGSELIGRSVSLPIELEREILRFCDPTSLAVCSRASLAMLELAAPLLYHDVVIRSNASLERLFCARPLATRQPQIEPPLYLGQITHLTFHQTGDDVGGHLVGDRVRSDLSGRRRVDLDTLTLVVDSADSADACPRLYSLVNPIHFSIRATGTDCHSVRSLLSPCPWERLQTIHVRNAALVLPDVAGPAGPVDIEYECSKLDYLNEAYAKLIMFSAPAIGSVGPSGAGGGTSFVGEVTFRVEHERAKGEVEAMIKGTRADHAAVTRPFGIELRRICDNIKVVVREASTAPQVPPPTAD